MIQVMGYYKQQTAVLIKFMDEAIALVNAGDSAGLQQLSTQLQTDIKNINAKASGITEKINEARSKIGLDGNP
jgi:hypothetical protein